MNKNLTSDLFYPHDDSLKLNSLGNTGIQCSPVGFGAYRIHPDIPQHRQALTDAVINGINLIDTSANYGDGGSEILIGQVLQDLLKETHIKRENTVLVSKAGYIQGTNLKESQQRKQDGKSWEDLVEFSPGIEHCIHPQFLKNQISGSLRRLQLEYIDIFLLHNPEYYLGWAAKMDIPIQEARNEYYRRLELAFQYLEQEVKDKRIRFYGVSSNSFPGHSDESNFTLLARLWEIAEKVNPAHHFRVIQLPMNLIEHQAVTTINQPTMQSVIEFAHDKKLGVLINRPLNAHINRRIFRLVDISGDLSKNFSKTDEHLNELIKQENQFEHRIIKSFELDIKTEQTIRELFSTGSYLAVNWQKLGPYHQWIDSQSRMLVERINLGMNILTRKPDLNDDQKKWIDHYIDTFNYALDGLTARYRARAAKEVDHFKKEISEIDEQWDRAKKLSQKAIRALRSTSGISSVLVGMRHPDYVKDIIEELNHPVEIRDEMHSWLALKEQIKGLKFE